MIQLQNIEKFYAHGVGKTFILPLYKAYSATEAGQGEGKNYFYNIVEFVGVRVQYTPNTNREIIVQPAPLIVPNALLGRELDDFSSEFHDLVELA